MVAYKMKRPIKGVYVRWHADRNQIFPDYRDVSGSVVSMRRINKAKDLVNKIIDEERATIEREFTKRCSGKPRFDFDFAKEKVNSTKLSSVVKPDESVYGMTTAGTIWITPMKMSDELLIGTLLHEALHDICTVNGKVLCERDDHHVLRALGDNC
jgi:hypothetical protein